jgi:hypothetical protein
MAAVPDIPNPPDAVFRIAAELYAEADMMARMICAMTPLDAAVARRRLRFIDLVDMRRQIDALIALREAAP